MSSEEMLAEALTPFALFANGLMHRDDVMAPVATRGNQNICVGAFQEARRTLIELDMLMPLGTGQMKPEDAEKIAENIADWFTFEEVATMHDVVDNDGWTGLTRDDFVRFAADCIEGGKP